MINASENNSNPWMQVVRDSDIKTSTKISIKKYWNTSQVWCGLKADRPLHEMFM